MDRGKVKSINTLSEADKEKQGYLGDLGKKSVVELKELIQRQEHLLANKKFLSRLPDKGGKIMIFKSQVEAELEKRYNVNEACELLSQFNIKTPEDLEWSYGKNSKNQTNLDSDDDSDVDVDPLKLVATHSGTVQSSTKKTINQTEPRLITEDDLKEIASFTSEQETEVDKEIFNQHVKSLCKRYGDVMKGDTRFRPNKVKDVNTMNNLVMSSAQKVKEKLGRSWEITAATPPVPVHHETKLLPLSESLIIQKVQEDKLKEIQTRQATERLMAQVNVSIGKLPVSNITEYRRQDENEEDSSDEESNNDLLLNDEES